MTEQRQPIIESPGLPPEEERDYLLKRARDHARLAERTDEAGARTIHLRLQRLYQTRADLIEIVHPD